MSLVVQLINQLKAQSTIRDTKPIVAKEESIAERIRRWKACCSISVNLPKEGITLVEIYERTETGDGRVHCGE